MSNQISPLQYFEYFIFSDALKLYRGKLTAFEQTEILDYPEIWFLGLEAKKIEGVPGSAQNNGYDDENGSYIKVSWLIVFTELNDSRKITCLRISEVSVERISV